VSYPFSPNKIDSFFNQKVSYGNHEGIDLNGVGGGNTDCGEPLKSISLGKCVHVSSSSKDYGLLVVIETQWSGSTYYIRYCHLQQASVVVDQLVSQGQVVGLMGSTGNSTACHLHLDILKKKPRSWRFYTQDVLAWFVDPVLFIKEYKGVVVYSEEQMTLARLERDRNWNLYQDALRESQKIKEESDTAAKYSAQLEKQVEGLLSEKKSLQLSLKASTDRNGILQDENDTLRDQVEAHVCPPQEAPIQEGKVEEVGIGTLISLLLKKILKG